MASEQYILYTNNGERTVSSIATVATPALLAMEPVAGRVNSSGWLSARLALVCIFLTVCNGVYICSRV